MPKVRDNQTGQVFEVPEAELGQYGLNAPSVQSSQSPPGMNITKEQVTKVLLDPNISDKTKTRVKDVYEINKGSTEEEKQERKIESTQTVLDNLSSIYFGKEGEKSLALGVPGQTGSRIAASLKNIGVQLTPGKEGSIEKRIYEYNRLRKSKMAFLAKAYGDTGNIAYQEQLNAIQSLPDTGTTPGEALTLWDTAYSSTGTKPSKKVEIEFKKTNYQSQTEIGRQKSEEFPQESIVSGQAPTSQPQNPLMAYLQRGMQGAQEAKNPDPNFLADLLFPRGAQTQRKINAGEDVGLDERLGVAGETAANVLPFFGPGGLALRLGLSGASRGLTEPGAGMGERVKGGAIEGATGLALGKGGQLLGKILRPYKTVGAMRQKAVQAGKDITFSGSEIAKAGEEYIKHDPLAKSVASKILPSIRGKQITLPNLMKKINVWNDAYTQAGKVGKSAEAGLNNALAQAAKARLAKKAPDVAKSNKLFRYLYGAKPLAKTAVRTGILGGLGGIFGYGGFKLGRKIFGE